MSNFKPFKIQTQCALLDVELGREELNKRLGEGKEFSITMEAKIKYVFGNDDGTSQEFVLLPTKIEVTEGGEG